MLNIAYDSSSHLLVPVAEVRFVTLHGAGDVERPSQGGLGW